MVTTSIHTKAANMEFHNKLNEAHKGEDGKTRFHSRSIAVSAAIVTADDHVLITQRSATMAHHPNKWCIPCGYLDWNESVHQALIREVFEEVGLNVDGEQCVLYQVSDNPERDELQNVSFNFIILIPKNHDEVTLAPSEEVQDTKWLSNTDINADQFGDLEFCFNHKARLKQLVKGPSGDATDGFLEHACTLDLTEKSQFKF